MLRRFEVWKKWGSYRVYEYCEMDMNRCYLWLATFRNGGDADRFADMCAKQYGRKAWRVGWQIVEIKGCDNYSQKE